MTPATSTGRSCPPTAAGRRSEPGPSRATRTAGARAVGRRSGRPGGTGRGGSRAPRWSRRTGRWHRSAGMRPGPGRPWPPRRPWRTGRRPGPTRGGRGTAAGRGRAARSGPGGCGGPPPPDRRGPAPAPPPATGPHPWRRRAAGPRRRRSPAVRTPSPATCCTGRSAAQAGSTAASRPWPAGRPAPGGPGRRRPRRRGPGNAPPGRCAATGRPAATATGRAGTRPGPGAPVPAHRGRRGRRPGGHRGQRLLRRDQPVPGRDAGSRVEPELPGQEGADPHHDHLGRPPPEPARDAGQWLGLAHLDQHGQPTPQSWSVDRAVS